MLHINACGFLRTSTTFVITAEDLIFTTHTSLHCRAKKLKETVAAVAQLDSSMTALRDWLNKIETDLRQPVVYRQCTEQHVQEKLAEEKVTSTVCDVTTDCDSKTARDTPSTKWFSTWGPRPRGIVNHFCRGHE